MDALQALDARLYLALATSGNAAASVFGLFFAAFAMKGLGWWAFALLGVRARGLGWRAARIALVTALGGNAATLIAEWLKPVVHRPRPFTALHVEVLIQPTSFSFPSGDVALAFGAATALARSWPAAKLPAFLVATAIAFGRVVVGAHYPSDVLAGAAVGVVCGLLADRLWALASLRRWRVFVVARTGGDRPWYASRDLLRASGESIVRDLQEGLRAMPPPAGPAAVVSCVDRDALPAQLPQILRGFGYDDCVVARGLVGEAESLGNVFWWQGPSGDRIRTTYPMGDDAEPLVGHADEPSRAPRARSERIAARIVDRAMATAEGGALLCLVDGAHAADPRPAAALAALRAGRLDARPSDLATFAASLGVPRATHAGELAAGLRRPAFRGLGSARAWLAQESAGCERLLVERCEPLDAFSGGRARDELRALWRELLESRAHGASCGCAIDAAHEAALADRLARIRSGGEALAERLMREVAGPGDSPLIWSFRPAARVVVAEIEGVPRAVACAPLGATPLVPLEGAGAGGVSSPEDGVLENRRFRVEVDRDGSFAILDRRSQERSGTLNVLIDEGDRGDLFTHAFAGPAVSARGLSGDRRTVVRGDRGSVTVDLALAIPAGLRSDRLARAPGTVVCPMRVTVTLDAPAEHVEVTLEIDNRARDHRVRVLCSTGVRSLTHRAEGAFGPVERPSRVASAGRWRERPNGDHATAGLVTVSGATRGLVLGLDGLHEYGIERDGAEVAITLFRAVGWCSRGDLRERPGHAGPALEAPSAQCIGPRTYRYVAVPFGAPGDRLRAERDASDALSPVVVGRGAGAARPLATVTGASVELSALRAGPGGTLVVRLVNRAAERSSAIVSFEHRRGPRAGADGATDIVAARSVDLREGEPDLCAAGLEVIRTAAPPELVDGRMIVELTAYEVGTYLVTLAA